jgi:hypothetical protein
MKCIDCGEETIPDGCWQCLEKPRLHPILQEPQFCEGVPCLRRVEIESDFSFEILYLRTESNVVALAIAVQRCPRAKFFRVTPVWE